MTIQEALQRLAQVLDKNARAYFYDLQYWLYEDYFNAIGIRRKSKGKCIRFYEDMEELEFDKVRAIIGEGDEFYHYRFSVEDLLANDWECVLMNMNCDFVSTFDDFLRENNDEVMYLCEVSDFVFEDNPKTKIKDVELVCPYDENITFWAEQEILQAYHNHRILGLGNSYKEKWLGVEKASADVLVRVEWATNC